MPINAASEDVSCPLDWRLFIPEEWDEPSEFNKDRRAKAHLPDEVCHEPKWKLALEMIDELRAWGLEPPIVLGDGAYGDITELRTGLEERGIGYMLGVKGATSAYGEQVQPERPEWSGRGRPPGGTLPRQAVLAARAGAGCRQGRGGRDQLARGDAGADALSLLGASGAPGELTVRVAVDVRSGRRMVRRSARRVVFRAPPRR